MSYFKPYIEDILKSCLGSGLKVLDFSFLVAGYSHNIYLVKQISKHMQ
jgi:hypothetical protein